MSMVAENMKRIAECSIKLIELCEKLGMVEEEKTKYPKSYMECVKCIKSVKEASDRAALLCKLERLLVCRDAYWKIAGEEMGLNKPWTPDYDSGCDKFGICCYDGVIVKTNAVQHWERHYNKVLDFPTPEMRDAFLENFKDLIEQCKELL